MYGGTCRIIKKAQQHELSSYYCCGMFIMYACDPAYKIVFARGSAPDCGIAPYAKSEMYTGLSVSGCWRLVLRWLVRPSLGQSGRIKLGMGLLLPPRLDPKSVILYTIASESKNHKILLCSLFNKNQSLEITH